MSNDSDFDDLNDIVRCEDCGVTMLEDDAQEGDYRLDDDGEPVAPLLCHRCYINDLEHDKPWEDN